MNNNSLNNRERYFRQLKGKARGSDVRGRYFMNIILILFFFVIIGSVVFFVKTVQGPMDDMKETYEDNTNINTVEVIEK